MFKEWIKKHRKFLRKSGGMDEKIEATNLKNEVSQKIFEQFDRRSEERRDGERRGSPYVRPLDHPKAV